ncbi:MAG: patatin family protein [Lachnospiraceae bacterium]|nr:patatin family protein [Lachnospiraceae bacterium]
MKTALVLEGGAMRGMYTAGVLDVFMENGLKFDAIIGASAGALFGVNYLSGQNGRAIRYNKKYNKDKNYMGIRPLLKEGNIVSTNFAYVRVPHELDIFDDETYKKSEVPFLAVVTNIETGEPEYIKVDSVFEKMDVLRASGSMPFVSTPVPIDGKLYLDGAITDSIPYQYMLDNGYDRVLVILTKKKGYVKSPIPSYLANMFYKRKYPRFANAVINRHNMYNAQMEKLKELEENGIATIIQTDKEIKIKKTEKDPEKLEALYQIGRADGTKYLEKLKNQDESN